MLSTVSVVPTEYTAGSTVAARAEVFRRFSNPQPNPPNTLSCATCAAFIHAALLRQRGSKIAVDLNLSACLGGRRSSHEAKPILRLQTEWSNKSRSQNPPSAAI